MGECKVQKQNFIILHFIFQIFLERKQNFSEQTGKWKFKKKNRLKQNFCKQMNALLKKIDNLTSGRKQNLSKVMGRISLHFHVQNVKKKWTEAKLQWANMLMQSLN